MATTKNIKIKPVDKTNWSDFETLFKSKGAPGYCWCMVWRMTSIELKNNNSTRRKKFLKQRVRSETPIGLLAYLGKDAIAWCSVEPDSPSYRFMGFVKTFEKANFNLVKKAGTRRNVMICKL